MRARALKPQAGGLMRQAANRATTFSDSFLPPQENIIADDGARISFVILTWNSERFIEECLDSVLGMEELCLEVLVEDNGSSDGTLRIMREIASRDARISITGHSKNLGTTIPRNNAFARISSEATHICVLDSDTVVNRPAFENMLNALNLDPSIGVAGPLMQSQAGESQLSGRNLPTLGLKLKKAISFGRFSEKAKAAETPRAVVTDEVQDVGYLLSACWLMPRTSLDSVGLLDEKIFYAPEDVDWCLRCWKAGLRVVLVHNARIIHAYQRISHNAFFSRINLEHLRGLAYYFGKHGYLFKAPKF